MSDPSPKRFFLRKLLISCCLLISACVLAVVVRGYLAFRDRIPGYAFNLDLPLKGQNAGGSPLRAGFARISITPDLSDPDNPIWLAGFSQDRRATSVHDPLWAIACVLDDGERRLGFVALDAIGFFQDDVVAVRKRVEHARLDFVTVCSTHNHSTPDLLGLWGPNLLTTGVNARYRQQVISACVEALSQAVSNLQPARVAFHHLESPTENLVADTRKPEAFDPDIRVMHFVAGEGTQTLGSIVTWGNHPETVWSGNQEITSDFCGYLRDALADGVTHEGRRLVEGLGGIHLFINGAVGGLMSTIPSLTVKDPFLNQEFKETTHQKARAVGHQIAARVLPTLRAETNVFAERAPISVRAKTVELPLANKGYLLAGFLGLIDRGHVRFGTLRTEVALLEFGDASIACIPGEIYPEIVNGGIEKPEGADFDIAVVETPPLRQLMPGKHKFVFGLANDEIGYILPKSQWDRKAPYTYGRRSAPYGEINSVGPETGPVIYRALKDLCAPNASVAARGSEANN